jgi:hypothetical protein
VGVRIAKGSIFGETGDKRVGIAAIPGFVIAAGDFGGFHCWSPQRNVFGLYLNSFFSVKTSKGQQTPSSRVPAETLRMEPHNLMADANAKSKSASFSNSALMTKGGSECMSQ